MMLNAIFAKIMIDPTLTKKIREQKQIGTIYPVTGTYDKDRRLHDMITQISGFKGW